MKRERAINRQKEGENRTRERKNETTRAKIKQQKQKIDLNMACDIATKLNCSCLPCLNLPDAYWLEITYLAPVEFKSETFHCYFFHHFRDLVPLINTPFWREISI